VVGQPVRLLFLEEEEQGNFKKKKKNRGKNNLLTSVMITSSSSSILFLCSAGYCLFEEFSIPITGTLQSNPVSMHP